MGTVVRRNAPNGEVSRPLLSFCVFVETSKKEKAPGNGALGQIQVFSLLVREVHDHGVGDDVAAFADVGIRQRDLPTSSQTGDILEVCRLGTSGDCGGEGRHHKEESPKHIVSFLHETKAGGVEIISQNGISLILTPPRMQVKSFVHTEMGGALAPRRTERLRFPRRREGELAD